MTLTFIPAVLLALALTATAQAKPVFVGQDEAAISENAYGLRDRALAAFRDLGAHTIRVNRLQWHPTPDDAPFAVRQAGFKVQLTIAGDLRYLRQQVRTYRTIVDRYSVWNEPELGSWRCCRAPWVEASGMSTRAEYRPFYIRAYRTIKRLDPSAKVMIGEVSPHAMGRDLAGRPQYRPSWFRRTLKRGRPLLADCVAVHPYYWAWSTDVNRDYRVALNRWGRKLRRWARLGMLTTPKGRRVPVCNTEFGEPAQWRRPSLPARAYKVCSRLRFRQCAQYQMFPNGQTWDTSLTDEFCQPTRAYLTLRRAIRGVPRTAPVPWRRCPDAAPFIKTPPGPGPYDRYQL